MSIVTNGARFSYVMTFRSDRDRRIANLCAVLRWLSQIRGMEVVLVEQDRTPQVTSDILPSNCTHYFVHNDGPFNRAWGMNVGFKRSSGAVVGFADADLITNATALVDCYERCRSEFEAVKPYDQLVDLTPEESRSILNGDWNVEADRKEPQRNREGIGEYVCFCGGLFLIRRSTYEELGGFDERFLGWGGEDDAMTSKLSRLVKNSGGARHQIAYHLWHERSIASRYFHPHYQHNLARMKWYAACDTQSLILLCQQDRQSMGRSDKYGPCNL
jgi:GT2 family glycosyltransferase